MSESLYEAVDLNDFSRGGVLTVDGGNTFLFPSIDLVSDYRNFASNVSSINVGGWSPLSARGGAIGDFLPREINFTEETNTAAYVRFDYEGFLGDMSYSGNFGFRYVRIENDTGGGATGFRFAA